jgi:hypothetical protein
MATTNAHKTSTTKRHDGGSFIGGSGDPTAGVQSAMTNEITVNDINGATNDGSTGGRVLAKSGGGAVTTDRAGIQTARGTGSGGTGSLAYYPDARAAEGQNRNFILRAAGDTNASRINNVAGTNLHVPAGDVATNRGSVPIHDNVKNRNRGDYSINVLAAPSTNIHPERTLTGAGVVANYIDPAAASGAAPDPIATDQASIPTRAVPGELTYHFGGLAKPTTDEYKARNAYEQLDGSSQ